MKSNIKTEQSVKLILDSELLEILNPNELFLLLHLAKNMDEKTRIAKISHSRLMKETGFGRDKFLRQLNRLIEKSSMIRNQFRDGGRFSINEYKLPPEVELL